MTLKIIVLIIWIICGILAFWEAATDKNHKVNIFSYACCWGLLIVKLILDIIG